MYARMHAQWVCYSQSLLFYFILLGLAFAYDPDGYSVEIIKRGGIDFGDVKKAT